MILLQILRVQVTVINHALGDLVIVHNLLVHVLEELDLLTDKLLCSRRVVLALGTLLVTHVAIYVPKAVLQDLESILGELQVQLAQIRNRSDRCEDCVILGG